MNSSNSQFLNLSRKTIAVDFPDIEMASVQDETEATGATLFYFPKGATVGYDSRGGSVASVETTLFDEGSYSNYIDALVFTGGSTMGLAATDGVRQAIFESRARSSDKLFDLIPSVPGAVVYDFGGRFLEGQAPLVFPDHALGRRLMDQKAAGKFTIGRAGAGVTTSFAKRTDGYFGGQGLSIVTDEKIKVMAATVINSRGELFFTDGRRAADVFQEQGIKGLPKRIEASPGKNTTLSIIVTNISLDRNSLKRLAVMVHSGMSRHIRPFHGPTDGDILFTVSTRGEVPTAGELGELEMRLGAMAADAMSQAIEGAITTSNPVRN